MGHPVFMYGVGRPTKTSVAKSRGSWVVGRGCGSWVWVVGVGVGVGVGKFRG